MKEQIKKIFNFRNRYYSDWKLLTSDSKGRSRDYAKMIAIEQILSSVFNFDKIAIIESRGGLL